MNQIKATRIRFDAAIPQLTVPDLVRTAEYYRDILGFQIAGYWDGARVSLDTDAPPVFLVVRRDQVEIFFNLVDQPALCTGRAQGGYDAYLRVTGIDALAEEFSTRGADILDGPENRVYGQRELVISDCNGLILAFGEETSQRAI